MSRSFYCNHCGKKVSQNALKCPSCGRYFGAVVCPRCSYSGDEKEFDAGCPSCGYLGDREAVHPLDGERKKKQRPLLDLPPVFFAVGILLLTGLLLFLIKLWL
ncbi:MAG: zinc-ribbon domain-containing protein [Spirochaetales bacterium]|nr:zinc-ribbon domain-containing protein [Spirochaetales bacterium]